MPLLNIPAIVWGNQGNGLRERTLSNASFLNAIHKFAGGEDQEIPTKPEDLSIYGPRKSLKVAIHLQERSESPGNIYYKDNKGRFSQQATLKLRILTEYNVQVEVEPDQRISYISNSSLRNL